MLAAIFRASEFAPRAFRLKLERAREKALKIHSHNNHNNSNDMNTTNHLKNIHTIDKRDRTGGWLRQEVVVEAIEGGRAPLMMWLLH